MDTMETFEFDKLEIDYNEIIYVKLWKSCKGKIHVNHLKYKGGKPRVKIDGNLSFIFRPYKCENGARSKFWGVVRVGGQGWG